MKILVVDDVFENIAFVKHFVERLGHEVLVAENGARAVEMFVQEAPHLVLMDVMMPVMDGYEAAAHIRAHSGARWVPLIFMSAKLDVDDQVQGLAVGDDYLVKPINLRILEAKIKAMQRIAGMQRALTVYAAELQHYRDSAEQEAELARGLMERMTSTTILQSGPLATWVLPAECLSGDLIVAHSAGPGRYYAMLADATGHGLPAALLQLPTSQVFYEMARAGYTLANIIATINARLKELTPTDRFVAATAVWVDEPNRIVEIWNGGNPSAVFVDAGGTVVREFASRHCALGIIAQAQFVVDAEVMQWSSPGELVIYSDGLLDAADAQGRAFGYEGLLQALRDKGARSAHQAVAQAVEQHLGGRRGHDDISLLTIACGAAH